MSQTASDNKLLALN